MVPPRLAGIRSGSGSLIHSGHFANACGAAHANAAKRSLGSLATDFSARGAE